MADRLTGTILDYAEQQGSPGDVAWTRGYNPAAGAQAEHAIGVRYQGPWDQVADGFHEHVRRQARALALSGCPVHLASLRPLIHYGQRPGSEEASMLEEHKDLIHASIGRVAAIVQQVVPNEGQLQSLVAFSAGAMSVLSPEEMETLHKTRVVYTVWERRPAPFPDVAALGKVGQAWVACEANRRMLIESGLSAEKVRTVPLPYFDSDPLLALEGRARKAPPGVVRFYHIGKWEPRKDQHQIIGAFLKAFRPGEAELFLKTSAFASKAEGYPQGPLESVETWMRHPAVVDNGWRFPAVPERAEQAKLLGQAGIKIYETRLTPAQMRALHEACDVYVTLSHGEGFDMPAFDAKLAGNLLVYTPSGGPQDFAGEGDLLVPFTNEIGCHPMYRWPAGSVYGDYAIDVAAVRLREARDAVLRGERRRGTSLERFRAVNVGGLMLKYLREIAPNLPGET